jgi:hypothetical protein
MFSIFNSAKPLIPKLSTSRVTNKLSFLSIPSLDFCTSEGPQMSLKRFLGAFTHNSSTDWNKSNDFFTFTKGRFLRNEENEMSLRHVRFDMNALARIAVNAAGSRSCMDVEKYPDGMFNKVFLMTMEDGKQVVAKVPSRNAGPARLTTASEVATMDFVSTTLLPRIRYQTTNLMSGAGNPSTPVPKVLDWCSNAESTVIDFGRC